MFCCWTTEIRDHIGIYFSFSDVPAFVDDDKTTEIGQDVLETISPPSSHDEATANHVNGGSSAESTISSSSQADGVPQPNHQLVAKGNPEAEKILALLSEIGSNQMLTQEFHPWFWEPSLGELMTV